ncbi:hypothetical protein ACFO5Q_10730 [Kordiimonas lipolytica]|uniref:Glycine zipper family protein n=1 Tax=Kordiimonas lipolytica TaxID=1662421 RepID=A0ABV8UAX9_9PROT|nr:hypothetical protein [Kordiimonas lipolytica]
MGTRVGFFLFVGFVLGAIVGAWLPYPAILETVVGGAIGAVSAVLIDLLGKRKRQG